MEQHVKLSWSHIYSKTTLAQGKQKYTYKYRQIKETIPLASN